MIPPVDPAEVIAERIVRSHDLRCAGELEPAEPWCSCAPTGYPLCSSCAVLVASIANELRAFSSALTKAQDERDAALDFISREGYRRCDAAACNCNGWHGGHAMARLTEIGDALRDADQRRNGPTILTDVRHVLAQLAEARQHLGTALRFVKEAGFDDQIQAARVYYEAHKAT